jgi:hypothetical protein
LKARARFVYHVAKFVYDAFTSALVLE